MARVAYSMRSCGMINDLYIKKIVETSSRCDDYVLFLSTFAVATHFVLSISHFQGSFSSGALAIFVFPYFVFCSPSSATSSHIIEPMNSGRSPFLKEHLINCILRILTSKNIECRKIPDALASSAQHIGFQRTDEKC